MGSLKFTLILINSVAALVAPILALVTTTLVSANNVNGFGNKVNNML